jgi:hypothetical protein
VIERLPRFSGRTTARYLVGWWVGSIVALACLAAYYVIPVDVQFRWLSVQGLEIIAFMIASWLIPGFVLGGWKALLVAVGRSAVRTGTDRALIVVFSLWAIAWPILVVVAAINHRGP